MKLLFVVLVAVCLVGIHASPLNDVHESRGVFHEAPADMACASAQILQTMGFLESDGRQSRKFREQEAAKECREMAGDNACDTSDRILSCMRNRGLATAVNILTLPAGGLGGSRGGGMPF